MSQTESFQIIGFWQAEFNKQTSEPLLPYFSTNNAPGIYFERRLAEAVLVCLLVVNCDSHISCHYIYA